MEGEGFLAHSLIIHVIARLLIQLFSEPLKIMPTLRHLTHKNAIAAPGRRSSGSPEVRDLEPCLSGLLFWRKEFGTYRP
jgi:hypothetical protein